VGEQTLGVVLLVDDEPDFLKVAAWRLQREGFLVYTENNGKDALAAARTRKPDVVILDYMMPQMNGYMVLEQLKADPATADIPVIILTAMGSEQKMADSLERGAVCHMAKPYDAKELIHEVRLAVAKKKSA
jgi:CheY-like chemotaxis protein